MADMRMSRGIEKVIALAALDAEFRRKLIFEREAAIDSCDIELSQSERAILLAIPNMQLDAAISKVAVPREARRQFLKGAVIAAVALVIGTCLIIPMTATAGNRISDTTRAEVECRQIVCSQHIFKEEKGRYASSIEELIKNDFLEANPGERISYKFEIIESGTDGFKLRALPQKKGDPIMLADESGEIRVQRPGRE